MSDIYSDSIYVQIKSPCKKRFPSPLTIALKLEVNVTRKCSESTANELTNE